MKKSGGGERKGESSWDERQAADDGVGVGWGGAGVQIVQGVGEGGSGVVVVVGGGRENEKEEVSIEK